MIVKGEWWGIKFTSENEKEAELLNTLKSIIGDRLTEGYGRDGYDEGKDIFIEEEDDNIVLTINRGDT